MGERRWAVPVALVAAVGLLAGCANGATDAVTPTSTTSVAPVDTDAQARADAWLAGAVVPPDAVASATAPDAAVPFSGSYYAWPCEPTVEATGYWTLEGATVADTAAWLSEHPTADLIVSTPTPVFPADVEIDTINVGNSSAANPLEGIAFTVSRTDSGVAIRAEIGAVPQSATCSENVGGPGQG
jgi:hypothetical protein